MQLQAFLSRFSAVLIASLLVAAPAVNGQNLEPGITCSEHDVNKEFLRADFDNLIQRVRNAARGFLEVRIPATGEVKMVPDLLSLISDETPASVGISAIEVEVNKLRLTITLLDDIQSTVPITFAGIASDLEQMKLTCCFAGFGSCPTMSSNIRAGRPEAFLHYEVETFAPTSQELAEIHAKSQQESTQQE